MSESYTLLPPPSSNGANTFWVARSSFAPITGASSSSSRRWYKLRNNKEFLQKLLGFQFTIVYKSGPTNAAADALSRSNSGHTSLAANFAMDFSLVSHVFPHIYAEIRAKNAEAADIRTIMEQTHDGQPPPHYTVVDGLLFYKKRLCLSKNFVHLA